MSGCLLLIDGTLALLFYAFFRWIDGPVAGIIAACITGWPLIKWFIRECIKEIKDDVQEERLKKQEADAEKRRQTEIQRQDMHCAFIDGISQEEFELLAKRVAKRIRTLTVEVAGPRIEGTVESRSGISTWTFDIDFNDFGHITGSWWITYRGNYDSHIPNRYADLMSEALNKKLSS